MYQTPQHPNGNGQRSGPMNGDFETSLVMGGGQAPF